jgi:hypothetical protein
MNLRSKLTYANVAATIALVLAVGGGTVYAAAQLGKNDVHSRNIARGAVKKSDLHKNAVTSHKIKNKTIRPADLAGVLINDIVDVTGSATGGPQSAINTATTSPLPLKGTTTFTPKAGQVGAVAAEAQFTIATTNAMQFCQPAVRLLVNGAPTRIFVEPDDQGNSTTLVTTTGSDAGGPFGLLSPGTPLTVTAQLQGDADCTADSRLDRIEVRIVQIH